MQIGYSSCCCDSKLKVCNWRLPPVHALPFTCWQGNSDTPQRAYCIYVSTCRDRRCALRALFATSHGRWQQQALNKSGPSSVLSRRQLLFLISVDQAHLCDDCLMSEYCLCFLPRHLPQRRDCSTRAQIGVYQKVMMWTLQVCDPSFKGPGCRAKWKGCLENEPGSLA